MRDIDLEDTRLEPPEESPVAWCAACGCEITSATYDGKAYTPRAIAEQTTKKFGRALCWNCYMKRQFGDRARTGDV